MDKNDLKISCRTCKHYHITWDKDFPKGCRAMGFKSANMPSHVVQEASGMPCQRYEKKQGIE